MIENTKHVPLVKMPTADAIAILKDDSKNIQQLCHDDGQPVWRDVSGANEIYEIGVYRQKPKYITPNELYNFVFLKMSGGMSVRPLCIGKIDDGGCKEILEAIKHLSGYKEEG